jgi:hypothetical protein
MGATSAGGTAYPPGKPVHPQFLVGFVLLDFFPAELVDLLKHADVEGKKFTWNLQLNDNTITNLNKWGDDWVYRQL